jgi:hypothetical protein
MHPPPPTDGWPTEGSLQATAPEETKVSTDRRPPIFTVASTCEEVLEAWQLVYEIYLRTGLIDPNPFQVHTVPQAVGPHAVVAIGRLDGQAISAISAYTDSQAGLPLDSVYEAELNELRNKGRRLAEVGLFADRREHINRSIEGILELMRFGFFYATYHRCDHIVIGVHPTHSMFYKRIFGFEQIGEQRNYCTVKNNPVILHRLDLDPAIQRHPQPRGLTSFAKNPVPDAVFHGRYRFDQPSPAWTAIQGFLAHRQAALAA